MSQTWFVQAKTYCYHSRRKKKGLVNDEQLKIKEYHLDFENYFFCCYTSDIIKSNKCTIKLISIKFFSKLISAWQSTEAASCNRFTKWVF